MLKMIVVFRLRFTQHGRAISFWILLHTGINLIFMKSRCLDYDKLYNNWNYDSFFQRSCFDDTRVEWIMTYF